MTDPKPELIAKVADAIDARLHEYRVDHDTWGPYCTCGRSAEELAVAVLRLVPRTLSLADLRNRAAELRGADQ